MTHYENESMVAIHEGREEEGISKFMNLDKFTDEFIDAYNNAYIWGVFVDEDGEIKAQDIWGGIMENIIK